MVGRLALSILASAIDTVVLVQLAPRYSVRASYPLTFGALVFVHVLALLTWKAVLWPKVFSPIRHLPQPSGGSFLMGQFSRIINEPTGQPVREWVNSIPNDGLIRYTTFLNNERVVPTTSKALAEVLVQKNYEFVKPAELRTGLGRILGVGILLAEGEEHKTQRRNLMPAFAYRHIKDLYPTFWSKSREMVEVVSDVIRSEATKAGHEKPTNFFHSLEMSNWLSRATLDIIGVAGVGTDFNAINDPDTELNATYRKIFQPSRQARILGLLTLIVPIALIRLIPIKRNEDIATAAASIRSVSRRIVRARKAQIDAKEAVGKDIISVALSSGGFTEDQLVDQMMTFLAAGHETTASATTWALLCLCQHPEMQTRLRTEIRTHLPSLDDRATPITAELLDRLPYLHAVCNEVLRMHSPVPLTRREAACDTSILGQFIPKGTDVILAPAATNTSVDMWGPDAMEFKPERWLAPGKANSGGADSNYSYLTFLHGPRSCIGQAFAKAEFACLLATIVGRFEMELADPKAKIEVETGITARPKGGLNLRVRIVEGW